MAVAPDSVKTLLAGVTELFSLPDIYSQLNEMIRDPRFSLSDIGKVIAKDPAMSARLLRLVNSPFYGFQSKIDTISRAITVVGVDDLYHLVVATCVVDRFGNIPSELVDMTAFWMRSMYCGVVAKLLAKQSMVLHSERLFLAGLLHDIGSLVLYQQKPEESLKVLLATRRERRLLAEFEREIIGFTHADVAMELIKSWGLPESLYESIGCYLNPESAQVHKLDAYLLNMASRLVDGKGRGNPAEATVAEFSEHALTVTRLNRVDLVLVMEQAEAEFSAVFEMMAPNKKFH
ncbi:MAG: HDOD domain-containing protein [Methylococcaceae bacterium]|nr:HDOD domain-containing protein [Methylococcaceae bacterium]